MPTIKAPLLTVAGECVDMSYMEHSGGLFISLEGPSRLCPVLLKGARAWSQETNRLFPRGSCEARIVGDRVVIVACGNKKSLSQRLAHLENELRSHGLEAATCQTRALAGGVS